VRVIEYRLEGVEGAEPLYRLATTILDHEMAPVAELAALYHERWEIETAFDELKTTCGVRISCCAVRHRIWCGRSSTVC